MDFNELLFREMSPFCISSASSSYAVVGFAGRAADETKEATHGGSQFYPFQLCVGAAIFTIVSNKQNGSQVQESRALYKHLNIMKG